MRDVIHAAATVSEMFSMTFVLLNKKQNDIDHKCMCRVGILFDVHFLDASCVCYVFLEKPFF